MYQQSDQVKRGKRKAMDSDDAPPSKRQAIQPHNQHHGLGQQVPAPPFYPATFPLVQTYHAHTQQGLWQQAPAEESAVKRGKRKAVELDDTRAHNFNIMPINGSISRGESSNIASTSKKTLEFFN